MNFLHYQLNLSPNDVVEVTLDSQANIRLFDDINFHRFQRGATASYSGGLVERSPVRFKAPHTGHWNLVIDRGGYPGTVRASVRVI